MNEFKRASEINRGEIKEILFHVPETRAERTASLLATINAHPEGLNLQQLIGTVSVKWGMTRKTIIEYLQAMERARYIHIKWFKVYPRKRKKSGSEDT